MKLYADDFVKVTNPGSHPQVQKIISITNGKALLNTGCVIKVERLELVR